jgi:hypothetical protein
MSKQDNQKFKADGIIRINTYSKWFNLLLIGLCFFFLLAVRLQVNNPTNGDEPHYLIMDYALVHDHNLNLKGTYKNERYFSFFPYHGLKPQGNPKIVSPGASKVYSPHGIGMPLLLAPGFFLAAKSGAVFEMVLMATVVVWLTWVWTKQVTKNRKLAYVAAALLTICYSFNGLAGYIYPDILIAAATLVSLIMINEYQQKPIFQLLLGLTLGFLILLHIRNLDIVLPALVVLGYKLWQSKRQLPWLTGLVVLAFIAYFFVSLHQWFGVWNISTAYGPGAVSFGHKQMLSNVSAMLFDSNRGLLIYNPVIVFIGLPLWLKQKRESLLTILAILVPSIVILAFFNQWGGGAAPNGRYIIDFLPAFIPAIAFAIDEIDRLWQRLAVFLLATLTFLITLDATLMKFPVIDISIPNPRSPLFAQIQRHTGLAIDHLIPTYSNVTTLLSRHGLLKLSAAYIVVVVLIAYGYFLSRLVPAKASASLKIQHRNSP